MESMESPPCLSHHSIYPGRVQEQGARGPAGIDINAVFLSALYIPAQLTGLGHMQVS